MIENLNGKSQVTVMQNLILFKNLKIKKWVRKAKGSYKKDSLAAVHLEILDDKGTPKVSERGCLNDKGASVDFQMGDSTNNICNFNRSSSLVIDHQADEEGSNEMSPCSLSDYICNLNISPEAYSVFFVPLIKLDWADNE